MKSSDFTTKVEVTQTPNEVFNAILNIRGWWSEDIEGSTNKLNDEFLYRYKDVHQSRIKLVEVVPDKKVVYHILDNYFNFTKDSSEWKDTNLVFEISQKGDKTLLKFTHQGLVPEYECFEICSSAWSNYINNSLHNLIVSGKGEPNPKEGGFNERLVEKHLKKAGMSKNAK